MTRFRHRLIGSTVAALAVAGCGDDGVSSSTRERLAARVAEAREAADGRDGAGVRRALASFRASVRSARERGEIAPDDAERLLRAALQASRRARAEITPEPTPEPTVVPTATATVTPPAQEPEPGGGNDEEKGKGETEGKGQEKNKEKGKGKGND